MDIVPRSISARASDGLFSKRLRLDRTSSRLLPKQRRKLKVRDAIIDGEATVLVQHRPTGFSGAASRTAKSGIKAIDLITLSICFTSTAVICDALRS